MALELATNNLENNLEEFCLQLHYIPTVQLSGLKQTFNNLPADPYLKTPYRFRRLSRFVQVGDHFKTLPHKALTQSKEYNNLFGGVLREFPELEGSVSGSHEFASLLETFISKCPPIEGNVEYWVHQIRIVSDINLGIFGEPVPEGIHRDEALFVGILVIDKQFAGGAETFLYNNPKNEPLYQRVLDPGDFLIFNDKLLWHNTTALKPIGSSNASRDVFIFSAVGLNS